LLALWQKYLAPEPMTKPGDSSLATALLDCREEAVQDLLGEPKHGTLRNRLRKLRHEIDEPYWELLALADAWAKEKGLCSRMRVEPGTMKRLPSLTLQQFERALNCRLVIYLLRKRLEPAEFEWVTRQLFGTDPK
jgi:hypothetical protein